VVFKRQIRIGVCREKENNRSGPAGPGLEPGPDWLQNRPVKGSNKPVVALESRIGTNMAGSGSPGPRAAKKGLYGLGRAGPSWGPGLGPSSDKFFLGWSGSSGGEDLSFR
jgi:hypothetical protein